MLEGPALSTTLKACTSNGGRRTINLDGMKYDQDLTQQLSLVVTHQSPHPHQPPGPHPKSHQCGPGAQVGSKCPKTKWNQIIYPTPLYCSKSTTKDTQCDTKLPQGLAAEVSNQERGYTQMQCTSSIMAIFTTLFRPSEAPSRCHSQGNPRSLAQPIIILNSSPRACSHCSF